MIGIKNFNANHFLPSNIGHPKGRAAITAQSHNLLKNFGTLPKLILNDSFYRAKEIDNKTDKGQKYSSKLWLCAVIAARPFGCPIFEGRK